MKRWLRKLFRLHSPSAELMGTCWCQEGEPTLAERMKFAFEFPHGLRCAECHREIKPGQPYTEKLSAMVGETPLVALTCIYCERTS